VVYFSNRFSCKSEFICVWLCCRLVALMWTCAIIYILYKHNILPYFATVSLWRLCEYYIKCSTCATKFDVPIVWNSGRYLTVLVLIRTRLCCKWELFSTTVKLSNVHSPHNPYEEKLNYMHWKCTEFKYRVLWAMGY